MLGRALVVTFVVLSVWPDATPTGGALPARGSPLSLAERRTTSGAVALANLSGEIEVLERSLAARERSPDVVAVIVDRLLTRASLLGRIADYERAAELGASLVDAFPGSAGAYVVRARGRAALHRFAEALVDLDRAEREGVDVAELRAGILEELGETRKADGIRKRPARDILETGAEAVRRGRKGDVAGAERLFAEAQHQYADVSPFPFAWLYLQQGLMWKRAGHPERARELFEAALERLPGYAPAIAQLAALEAESGRPEPAIELLRPLVAASDDPEYAGQLSALLQGTGRSAEAAELRRQAARRFDELVSRHPEAFAAKASRFWRTVGGDPQKALALARRNLAVRRTPEDLALRAEAEAASLP